MVYLPKEVEEYITEFCTEYSITRKDKEGNILPSLGTGIVTYLKSKISGESPDDILTKPSKLLSTGLGKEEVLDLVNEYFTSHLPSIGLSKDEVIDLIERSVTNSHLPQSIGARDVEKLVIAQIEPLAASLAELETYTQNQFKAVREELKKAISDRSVTTESIANGETTPAKTTLLKEGEYISFFQLAKQLSYSIPDGVKASNPRTEGAEDLIVFAASLGQSYGWHGKKQKFYRIEV